MTAQASNMAALYDDQGSRGYDDNDDDDDNGEDDDDDDSLYRQDKNKSNGGIKI